MKEDINSKQSRGRQASIDGFAHEHIVVGILMKKFQNVSLVDLPLSPYDIVIVTKADDQEHEDIIRIQVKTASNSVSFTGGTRGGVDREYKSNIKTYVQSTKTSDLIVAIKAENNDTYHLYFVPTILVEQLQTKSVSLNKIQGLKNNYDFLVHCKNHEYIIKRARELGII